MSVFVFTYWLCDRNAFPCEKSARCKLDKNACNWFCMGDFMENGGHFFEPEYLELA